MGSFIENTNEKFIITTLKTADDGSGLIIRGYNSLSSPIATSLKLLIPVKKVQLVSLDEKLVEPLSVSADGFFDLHIGGHKIITLRLLD
jgi:alpha-mannosidase